jgi:peptidoglycan/xylan/chitin deacetylase (PgdA/CDA1 family)
MSLPPKTDELDIALSFDDGPSPWTPPMLDLLAEHRARATFFVLGANVPGREDILRRALAEGHELGLHTWSHPNLTELSDDLIREEMSKTKAEIERAVGVSCRLWRPPYYAVDERVRLALAETGLVEAQCSIAPEDYHWPAERTVAFVIGRLEPGAIVDIHDGRPEESGSDETREESVVALESILEEMDELGYRSIPISELISKST